MVSAGRNSRGLLYAWCGPSFAGFFQCFGTGKARAHNRLSFGESCLLSESLPKYDWSSLVSYVFFSGPIFLGIFTIDPTELNRVHSESYLGVLRIKNTSPYHLIDLPKSS